MRAARLATLQGWKEATIETAMWGCTLVSVLTTAGIIAVLGFESFAFFRHVSPLEFLTGTRWTPLLVPRSFGVLPLVAGTAWVVGGGLFLALPVGIGSALYLSEYAPNSVRAIVKPILEVLAGIPSVVYGYFALTFITPYVLQPLIPGTETFNAASAAIVLAVMLTPTISSLCDDAFRSVPQTLRDAAYALSATRLEVSTRVVLPSARSGVVAATLLGLSRAIGETMAVALAAGMTPKMTSNPFESVQTMTAYIVQVSLGDTPAGTVEYQTIFAVGMLLFVITLSINWIAHHVLTRSGKGYE
jgi:phosphate transport system permease protein